MTLCRSGTLTALPHLDTTYLDKTNRSASSSCDQPFFLRSSVILSAKIITNPPSWNIDPFKNCFHRKLNTIIVFCDAPNYRFFGGCAPPSGAFNLSNGGCPSPDFMLFLQKIAHQIGNKLLTFSASGSKSKKLFYFFIGRGTILDRVPNPSVSDVLAITCYFIPFHRRLPPEFLCLTVHLSITCFSSFKALKILSHRQALLHFAPVVN